jgi:hypothetical protein
MLPVNLLLALGIAIVLPVLAAKGKAWRGLWFGLSVASLVIAIFLGSQPVLTLEQTRTVARDQSITPEQYKVMEDLDTAGLALFAGTFLGCLIAGLVYRKQRENFMPR